MFWLYFDLLFFILMGVGQFFRSRKYTGKRSRRIYMCRHFVNKRDQNRSS